MSEHPVCPTIAHQVGLASRSETRLDGWRLVAGRIVVGAAMGVVAVLFMLALPGSVRSLATPCADPVVDRCLISSGQVASLAVVGVAPGALALIAAAVSCVVVLLVDGVAAVLMWRRSDDWMVALVALDLILSPVSMTPVLGLPLADLHVLQLPIVVLSGAGNISLYLLIALFPSGRFVPRWLWLPLLVILPIVSPIGNLPLPLPAVAIPDALVILAILGLLLCFAGSQIYRYRRVSTPMQRQQTKWVVYGFVLFIAVNQLFWQPYLLIPSLRRPDSLFGLLAYPDDFLGLAILVVTLGVAIMRYRLYDIDLVIRRTLVYGSLTATLVGLYLVLVLGAQSVVHALTGQRGDEPIIIVASTLLIAALFNPLRQRLQRTIDRRFYRAKYDAAKTLAAFGRSLRTQTDLPHLTEHLVAVVEETMRPAYVSLVLRTPHAEQASHDSRA